MKPWNLILNFDYILKSWVRREPKPYSEITNPDRMYITYSKVLKPESNYTISLNSDSGEVVTHILNSWTRREYKPYPEILNQERTWTKSWNPEPRKNVNQILKQKLRILKFWTRTERKTYPEILKWTLLNYPVTKCVFWEYTQHTLCYNEGKKLPVSEI